MSTGHPPPGRPVPPIAIEAAPAEVGIRLGGARVEPPPGFSDRLAEACAEVRTDEGTCVEAGRDWWPLAIGWALDGRVPARPWAVVRPQSTSEVSGVVRLCSGAGVPLTAAGGRSGVCGASIPVHGGVVLDLTALSGIVDVDAVSLTAEVRAGTFGEPLEEELRTTHGLTLGHWPQSIALSTVGGWLACRSAGQLSTRYGKIEDMVVGLEVVLADGRVIHTGGAPRAAVGPDLTQLFVGSEGTLGVITSARLRLHPAPEAEQRSAWSFATFADGLDACRRVLQRGATPAVLRLYDATEAARSYGTDDRHVLLVMDEGDPEIVDATMAVVLRECASTPGAEPLDDELVERWLAHRNDVSALEALTRRGIVVDTMEVAAPWSALGRIYERGVAAILSVEHAVAASAHQSHSYTDGACLYFSFAGRPPAEGREAFYVQAWDAATRVVLDEGGALSHHHGVGLNRSRFVRDALGPAFDTLAAVKAALDPAGVLNPGKLGLPSPFGEVDWP